MNKENLMWCLCMVCFTILGYSINTTYGQQDTKILNEVKPLYNYSSDCSNLSIINTSYCLKDELSKWYEFNMSNYKKELTFEQLKEQGGVCHHYSDWYNSQAKVLGFISKEVIIDTSDKEAHEFTVISNADAYCVLDQLIVGCVSFANYSRGVE